MIRRFFWLVVAGVSSVWIPGGATVAAQEPGVEFAVQPGPGSQTAPDGGYFVIEAGPGERVRQSIVLRNESNGSLNLQLAAVDGTTGQLGGVSYGLPDDPVERTGAWITLSEAKVPLDAGESRRVPFEVVVPQDARTGEHVAGIAVWESGGQEEGNDDAVSIVVQTRRIMAVQVDVPGAKDAELVVTGVEAAARPDGLYLEIGIENQGTAMTTGEGTVEIPSTGFVADFAVDTFVPDTSIAYPLKWTDEPEEGVYEARVELEYEGRLTEWEGTFTVGDPVLADLEDRGVDVPGGVPIVPIIGAAAVTVAAAAALLWARRRRSPGAPSHPAPATRSIPQRAYGSQPTAGTARPAASAPGGEPPTASGPARPRYPTSGPPPPPPPPRRS